MSRHLTSGFVPKRQKMQSTAHIVRSVSSKNEEKLVILCAINVEANLHLSFSFRLTNLFFKT